MANNKQLDRLKSLLKDLFQLDQPELDFGLYKIMHAKSVQITRFLENDLLKEIETAFGARDSANAEQQFAQAKAKLFESLGDTALDANGELNPAFAALPAGKKYLEDMAAAQAAKESLSADAEIYDHLYRFFERYYDNGDFLSRRYYARESDTRAAPYSVPYDGREVYLHWANKDQYYIKSGENFTHYTFDLIEAVKKHLDSAKTNVQDGAFDFEVPTTASGEQKAMKVHLRIAEAQEGEHGNVKATGDQKREFIPLLSKPAELDADGSLVLNFEYKVLTEGYPYDEAEIKAKYGSINKEHMPAHWMADVFLQAMAQLQEGQAADYMRLLSLLAPTDKQTKRPLLAKYISLYAARNTMDYFIHKDLGGFLRRELDFYIKNEVMRLDDIENADAPKVEQYLGKVKVLRRISHQLIAFLAQLEDFQKKLWTKKKFVTDVNYCVSLNRIPTRFYPAIVANKEQILEWINIFSIDEIITESNTTENTNLISVDFLKANPFLLIDTVFFDESFKNDLISEIDNLDTSCDGILINGDNFQAMNLIRGKLMCSFDALITDPPYNTGDDGFHYKDCYFHSSWLSMMLDRLSLAKSLMKQTAWVSLNINDIELTNLTGILGALDLPPSSTVTVKMSHMSGMKMAHADRKVPKVKEYITLSNVSDDARINPIYEICNWFDAFDRYDSYLLRNNSKDPADWTRSSLRQAAILKNINVENIEEYENFCLANAENIYQRAKNDSLFNLPRDGKFRAVETATGMKKIALDGKEVLFASNYLREINGKKVPAKIKGDIWDDIGINNSHNEGGVSFNNGKKPVKLFERLIGLLTDRKSYVLDIFGGSGTIVQAVMNTNSAGGARKYVVVEAGEYFDRVLKRRVKNVAYSSEWQKGKPIVNSRTTSVFVKYFAIESYEDALNNLMLANNVARDGALDGGSELRSAYMLNYWLDVETQGSPSLLNVQAFADPTNYAMKIKRPGSDALALQRIDLIETFNWLIGMWVEHLAAPQTFSAEFEREVDKELPKDQNTRLMCKRLKQDDQGPYWFRLVEGYTLKVPGDDSSRQKTLVVWRKLTDDPEQDNAALQKFLLEKLQISPRENTYAVIYVNGSHTLPNPLVEAEQTKVRLIEEAFHAAMWSQEAN